MHISHFHLSYRQVLQAPDLTLRRVCPVVDPSGAEVVRVALGRTAVSEIAVPFAELVRNMMTAEAASMLTRR